ncbi:MAG: response regulator [Desulfobacteraceae bacterium]|jgi:CheY-like chemotaxis protein|nr:response regulator [Desulfobacteraceae bacterium]
MSKTIKVLMIDDEEDFCYFVKKNLMQYGVFDVITATNGMQGVELAKKEHPDIILLDLVMPDMPGDEVAVVLNNHDATADIPIIFITALATDDDIDKNEIRNYILSKPVRTITLIKTIRDVLSKA